MYKNLKLSMAVILSLLIIAGTSFAFRFESEASSQPDTPPAGKGSGLTGEYYDTKDYADLKLTRIDPSVDFNWGKGSPESSIGMDTFSVRWQGYIEPLYSETYTFHATTDDGIRLWVNNQLLIDKWHDQSATENTGSISLSAGRKYYIRMDYYENEADASAKLMWSAPSQSKQVIPKTQLYPITTDIQAPSAPGSLTATGKTQSSISLVWSAASDNVGVAGYEVYRNNYRVGVTSTNTFTDTGLSPDTSYNYSVIAYDSMNNYSSASNTISVKTDSSITGIAPIQLNLSGYFNEDAFSYNSNKGDGNYDGSSNSYSADNIAANHVYEGITYTLGSMSDRTNNSIRCSGQKIYFQDGKYSSIRLLGSATNEDKTGTFRLNYTNSGYSDVKITLKDWCSSNTTGQKVLLAMNHRHNSSQDENINTHIFAYYLDTHSDKTVSSITLPNNRDMHVLAITLVPAQPEIAATGTGTGLKGEYFDNKDFTRPMLTRTDPVIDYNWDKDAPCSTMESDSFSVRWTGQIEARYSETYTFHAIADDGIRLWVNNKLLIDKWNASSATEHSGSIRLEAGEKYYIKMEYFEDKVHAVARLMWSSPSQAKEIIPKSQLYPVLYADGTGLKGEYFDSKNFKKLKAARIDPCIDFNWGRETPVNSLGKDDFSVRWTGYVQPKYSEKYNFYTVSDDGVRLWINDKLIINRWYDHSFAEYAGSISLEAGKKYKIKLEYYENKSDSQIKLMWSSPSQKKEVVPKSQLFPNN